MTRGVAETDERGRKLLELEKRMLAAVGRAPGYVEQEMAAYWGCTARSVALMADEVRARWAAEAPHDRAERLSAVRRTLEELADHARREGKLVVTARALEMLIALDGLAQPARSESLVQVQALPPGDSPADIALEAVALLPAGDRAALIARLQSLPPPPVTVEVTDLPALPPSTAPEDPSP